MFDYIKNIQNQFSFKFTHFLAVLILSIYPTTFFIGTGVVNFIVVLLDLILIFELIKDKKISFLNNKIFFYLIILWIIFLINLIFSINFQNSSGRALGFIRYIFFVMAIIYYFNFNNHKYLKIILFFWSIIFIIITLDLIYEAYYGKNILGFTSYMPGRLSGFFNDELKIGHFYYGFCLLILSFYFNFYSFKEFKILNYTFKKKDLIFIFATAILIVAFLIGERSNFLKILIMFSLFIFFIKYNFNLKKIIIFFTLMIILLISLNLEDGYKKRFLDQFIYPLINNPIKYIQSTNYGDHYKFGLKIFMENKLFGIGLKNYRIEVGNKNYVNSSIHPHQTHIEILSELGIIGYLSFLTFFLLSYLNYNKNINQKNNFFNLAGLLYIITTFLPLLPSGSFFTSHAATIFWMNYAVMNMNTKVRI